MSEKLRYIHFEKGIAFDRIVFQFEGGGAMIVINETDNSDNVIGKLRQLADTIEKTVERR